MKVRKNLEKHVGVIDLFCGIGGLSYGFKSEGFRLLAGFDSDVSCQFAYETNVEAPFVARDIEKLSGAEIKRRFAQGNTNYTVLIGCAPCTPFSIYTGPYHKKHRRKRQWQLLREFARIARVARPDVISMENVPRLIRHRIFDEFVRELRSAGYFVTYEKVRADHYGVPQRRARLVLFASRWGEVRLPKGTHKDSPVTVRAAIGAMPPIAAGKRSSKDRLHFTRGLSPLNLARLKATGEGGSWQDWDPELQLQCHKKRQGKSFRSVYGRMQWDAPSPVITTQCLGIGNGRFGHPEQDRAISIREAALLQSFPKKFRFIKPRGEISGLVLSRQIGNAVPVRLSRVIARAIRHHLAEVEADCRGANRGAE